MNIFVSNLSFRISDDDLKQLFEEYGEITSAKVITDKFSGRSRGFGFVEMKEDEAGQKAIDELNNADYDGKAISVSVAKPRTENGPRRSFGGGGDRGGERGGYRGGGNSGGGNSGGGDRGGDRRGNTRRY